MPEFSKLSLFAKKFLQSHAISVPAKMLEHPRLPQFLLTIAKVTPPTEKALNYARQLEKLSGINLPHEVQINKQALSHWISETECKLNNK